MNNDETLKRLPCRGCLSDCIYYSECEGRLWRLTEIRKKKPLKPDANDVLDISHKK